MKSKIIIICMLLSFTLISQAGQIFSDDFNDGDMLGWQQKRGTWTVGGDTDKYISSNNNYGVIWNDGSFGVDQSLQVDAYYDIGGSLANTIAHLRLRSDTRPGSSADYWNSGYLADVQTTAVRIYNLANSTTPIITHFFNGESLFTEDGWYTLNFEVSGTGSDTRFKFSVENTTYIDTGYNNTIEAVDSGYIGLGREIKYDNFQSSTDVPEPATLLLSAVGVGCVRLLRRRRAI